MIAQQIIEYLDKNNLDCWDELSSASLLNRSSFITFKKGENVYIAGGLLAGSVVVDDVFSTTDGITWKLLVASAPWGARQGAGTYTVGDDVYIIGGYNKNTYYKDIWKTMDGIVWVKVRDDVSFMDGIYPSIVKYKDAYYKFLGRFKTNYSALPVMKSFDGVLWTKIGDTNSPINRYQNVTFILNDRVYIAGGDDGSLLRTVYSTTDFINWKNEGDAPWSERVGASTYTIGDYVYIAGGYNLSTYFDDVWRTKDGNNWEQVICPKPFIARGYFGVSTIKDKVIILGGNTDNNKSLGNVYMLDTFYKIGYIFDNEKSVTIYDISETDNRYEMIYSLLLTITKPTSYEIKTCYDFITGVINNTFTLPELTIENYGGGYKNVTYDEKKHCRAYIAGTVRSNLGLSGYTGLRLDGNMYYSYTMIVRSRK